MARLLGEGLADRGWAARRGKPLPSRPSERALRAREWTGADATCVAYRGGVGAMAPVHPRDALREGCPPRMGGEGGYVV